MDEPLADGRLPFVSVIVPAYNAADTLPACLAALGRQAWPGDRYEIIVADDGSTDTTAEVANRAGVRVIRIPHGGPAAARNAGVEAARGEIALFTDADCEPGPEWVERMIEPFRDPAVVGAKGTYRTRQRELTARFVQLEYEDKYGRMAGQSRIDFIDTYSAGYRRDVFLNNEGFDPIFTTSSVEDQEFSFRLAQKGYRLVFVPSAIVYHRHDRTLAEYARRKFGIGYWKALLTRWHPERVVRDSHTPQTLKLQMVLLALGGMALLLWPFWSLAAWGAAGAALAFVLSAVPFLLKVVAHDPAVAAIALPMLLLRAATLSVGLLAGLAAFAQWGGTRRPVLSGRQRVIKRLTDLIVALVLLIVLSPFMLIISILIKLDSRGSVLFTQARMGENGRPFRMIKFRSMVDNAEELLGELVDMDALDSPYFKLPDDPRVTRVGRWLRRWSLDELPQLWNVIRGEMSLVGPRPEETLVVARYNDWHRKRLAVKPGMTGPMQVDGRGDLDLDERVRLELDYIENYSLWRDLRLLAQTAPAVIRGEGAY